jgi:uncharacterized protein (TIGR02246 family)
MATSFRKLRFALPLLAGLCLAATGRAQQNDDEAQIEDAAEKFVAAYNDRKLDDILKLFTEDAEFLPLGEDPLVGSAAIREAFTAAFEANPKVQISLSMDSLRFVTPDVAFEDGETISFADGETPTTRSRYSVVHVKRKGVWRMKLVRELEEEPLSPFARLRELEWLTGDWVDEGPDSVVTTSCRWDENKTFLLRTFEAKTRGDVVLKGEQRIGWDAVAKQVRSWTFDDAGGFVEGIWTQVDDRWVIKSTGFRPDGQAVSATQVVTSLGEGRMEWTMEGRLVGDTPLPSITVVLVRRAPEPTESGDN